LEGVLENGGSAGGNGEIVRGGACGAAREDAGTEEAGEVGRSEPD